MKKEFDWSDIATVVLGCIGLAIVLPISWTKRKLFGKSRNSI